MVGYAVILHGGIIATSSKGQASVSISSTEAELKAATRCGQALVSIREFAMELQILKPDKPITIYEDNEPTRSIILSGRRNTRKGMEKDAFWICEKIASGFFKCKSCNSSDMLADLMTKTSLPISSVEKHRTGMGIVPPPKL